MRDTSICFVCGQPTTLQDRLALTGHVTLSPGGGREDAPTIRLHAACAPYLASQVLAGMPGPEERSPLQARPGEMAALTPWESRILAGVARGETNRQIGRDIGASEKTVKNAVSIILDKLEVQSRAGAAAVAVRYGLVT